VKSFLGDLGDHLLDVFVQVLGVLTVGRRTGGAGMEPGWVWSRSVPVEPQDSSGAVMLCLHNGVGVGGS
jgi:hypothetical protein